MGFIVAVVLILLRNSTGAYERNSDLVATAETSMEILDLSEFGFQATNSDEALEVLGSLTGVLNIDSAGDELSLKNENAVGDSTYYRFQQEYQGLMVYGRSIVLSTDAEGNAQLLAGNLVDMSVADTEAQIDKETAISYALNYLSVENNAEVDAELCYYVTAEDNEPLLAYAVKIGFDTVFVDAAYGTVLGESSGLSFVTAELQGQSEKRIVNIITDEAGLSSLVDSERNISVFTSADLSAYLGNPAAVSQSDFYSRSELITFPAGDDPDKTSAVDALYNISIAYDFYSSVLNHISTDGAGESEIRIYDDCQYYPVTHEEGPALDDYTNNAAGGSEIDELFSIILVGPISDGSSQYSAYIDVMAHEYTHAVMDYIAPLEGTEAKAIGEAIPDIIGEMAEAWNTGSCDWKNILRNYASPEESPDGKTHLSSYSNYTNDDGKYTACTILSHAAYLMWTGDESTNGVEAINDVNLMSELWYRTMLLLNSDATFSDCRICCETAAEQMMNNGWLTEEQHNCVIWAFDQVGIIYVLPTSNLTIKAGNNFDINVHDYNENPMEEYIMTVSDYNGQVIDILNGEEEGSCVTLNLDAGIYRITVSSPDAAFHDVSSVITVAGKYDPYIYFDSTIDIYTTFGTSLQGQVMNGDGQPLEGVQVTIATASIGLETVEQLSEETGVAQNHLLAMLQATTDDTFTLITDANGNYTSKLPVGVYELTFTLDGYETESIRQVINVGKNVVDVEMTEANSAFKTEDALLAYATIIDEYVAACSINSTDFVANQIAYFREFPNVVERMLTYYYLYDNFDFCYTYYDVDNNGISELLIATENENTITLVDIYAFDGQSAVKLFDNDSLGDRSFLTIFTDGTMYLESSGGASYGEATYYRLDTDGFTIKSILNYTMDSDNHPSTPWYNGSEWITYEEFQAIQDQYTEITLDGLSWTDIKPTADSNSTAKASNKQNLREYLNMNIYDFAALIGGMEDVHSSDGIELSNGAVIATAYRNDEMIFFFGITGNCDYAIDGIEYGMTMSDAREILDNYDGEFFSNNTKDCTFDYNDGSRVSVYADADGTVNRIYIWLFI